MVEAQICVMFLRSKIRRKDGETVWRSSGLSGDVLAGILLKAMYLRPVQVARLHVEKVYTLGTAGGVDIEVEALLAGPGFSNATSRWRNLRICGSLTSGTKSRTQKMQKSTEKMHKKCGANACIFMVPGPGFSRRRRVGGQP